MRDFKRQGCDAADRVFGDMLALTRYPYRLQWYARYPSKLVDLRGQTASRDPAISAPEGLEAALGQEAQGLATRLGLAGDAPAAPLPQKNEEALRSLGYIE